MKRTFRYAWNGFKTAFSEERNLRIHTVVASIALLMGFYFQITSLEWISLMLTIGLVISLELVNSAIENLTDLVTKEQHPLAGKVKDISAAAVLFASVISVIVGLLIFVKYFQLLLINS